MRIVREPTPSAKTYSEIPALLTGPDMKAALVSCWQAYNTASHKDAMAVAFNIKSSYIPSEYEDESGTFTMKVDEAIRSAAGSAEAAATDCVKTAVEQPLKDLKTVKDSFSTRLTISVK